MYQTPSRHIKNQTRYLPAISQKVVFSRHLHPELAPGATIEKESSRVFNCPSSRVFAKKANRSNLLLWIPRDCTRSTLPQPLKSPVTTEPGISLVSTFNCEENVPSPIPNSTAKTSRLLLIVAMSRLPSLLKSAATKPANSESKNVRCPRNSLSSDATACSENFG